MRDLAWAMETCFERLAVPSVSFQLPELGDMLAVHNAQPLSLIDDARGNSPPSCDSIRGKKPRISPDLGQLKPKQERHPPNALVGKTKLPLWPNTHHLLRFPVPTLEETRLRLLAAAQPLLTPEQYDNLAAILAQYCAEIGPRAQQKMKALGLSRSNWLETLWVREKYLKIRAPLPVSVSPAILFPPKLFPPNSQPHMVAFLARLVHATSEFYDFVNERCQPLDKSGKFFLDMSQYDWLFATTRLPGKVEDSVDWRSGRVEHFVVAHRGHFYSCPFRRKMSVAHLKKVFWDILGSETETASADVGLGTGIGRSDWAKLRESLDKGGADNAESLEIIDSAAFLLCIDEEDDGADTDDASAFALNLLHGNGANARNRWYDKMLSLVVSSGGRGGLIYEHSQMEGTPLATLADHILTRIAAHDSLHLHHQPSPNPGPKSCLRDEKPYRLLWNISDKNKGILERAQEQADKLAQSLDAKVFTFRAFGKDFPKSVGLSPDSFIQVAISVAFWRVHGSLSAQYETGSLRVFRRGRTETIRLPSAQSAALCVHDADWAAPDVRAAVDAHKDRASEACRGHGFDRHLLGLRTFGQPAHALFNCEEMRHLNHFRLSTSQLPCQSELVMTYGPLAHDGYAVCYTPKESHLLFALTSERDCPLTDLDQFQDAIAQTLSDMKTALE